VALLGVGAILALPRGDSVAIRLKSSASVEMGHVTMLVYHGWRMPPPPEFTKTVTELARGFREGVRLAQQVQATWQALEQAWHGAEGADPGAVGASLEDLLTLSPQAFEQWVAARFEERGFRVRHTGAYGAGGDHGIDLVAVKAGERAVVQCKHWRAWAVGEPVLRDLYGVLHAAGADRAYLVTTGRVSGPARRWAQDKPIIIWDRAVLRRLLGRPRVRVREVRPASATLTTPPLLPSPVKPRRRAPRQSH
jgi:hypothetical protein